MRNARWLIPFPLLLWSGAAPLAGAEVGGQEVPRLRVGVVEAAPFAMAGAAGSFDGVAIEMWQRATRALGIAESREFLSLLGRRFLRR